jgi:membrane protein implicated in regulation of membrane protease activity
MDTWVMILLGVGAGLMLAEILLPGGIAIAFGLSLLVVAALRYFGWVGTLPTLALAWLLIAPVLLVSSLFIAGRFFGGSRQQKGYVEEREIEKEFVEVIEPVSADSDAGRVKWRGTSWAATCVGRGLAVGERARILKQENLTLIVQACSPEANRKTPS